MRDPSYQTVKTTVQGSEAWNINRLKRKLRISYTRASLFADQFITDGILSSDLDTCGYCQTITNH